MWDDLATEALLEYLEKDGNYRQWRNSGVKTDAGGTNPNGVKKIQFAGSIAEYLGKKGISRNATQVKSKIKALEDKFRHTLDMLNATGEGLSTIDQKMASIRSRPRS